MRTSITGKNLIMYYEGLRLKAYQDTGGVWTIGYGHTGPEVKKGLVITREQAEEYLATDLHEAELAVQRCVHWGMSQHQFDALVSFVYNLGVKQFENSTLLKKLNAKDILGASKEFGRWVYDDGKVQPGLIERREAERKLFLIG